MDLINSTWCFLATFITGLARETYLGAPFEYTWSDYNDERGFTILDTETLETIYIRNPYTMFEKLVYSDVNQDNVMEYFKSRDIAGKIVKLIVKNKNSPYIYDKVVDLLQTMGAFDLQIVDLVQMDLTQDA